MIELDLDVEDLVGMRFAVSPLMETIASLIVHTGNETRPGPLSVPSAAPMYEYYLGRQGVLLLLTGLGIPGRSDLIRCGCVCTGQSAFLGYFEALWLRWLPARWGAVKSVRMTW